MAIQPKVGEEENRCNHCGMDPDSEPTFRIPTPIRENTVVIPEKKTDAAGRVLCKCGKVPYMDTQCGDTGSNANGVEQRMKCPDCGTKGAEYRKSYSIAQREWEESNWKK